MVQTMIKSFAEFLYEDCLDTVRTFLSQFHKSISLCFHIETMSMSSCDGPILHVLSDVIQNQPIGVGK